MAMPSGFVAVRGRLACPTPSLLFKLPFGKEWRAGSSSSIPASARLPYRACLRTSFIDIDAPHRLCRWSPHSEPNLSAVPASASEPGPLPSPVRRLLVFGCGLLGLTGVTIFLAAGGSSALHSAPPHGSSSAARLDAGAAVSVDPHPRSSRGAPDALAASSVSVPNRPGLASATTHGVRHGVKRRAVRRSVVVSQVLIARGSVPRQLDGADAPKADSLSPDGTARLQHRRLIEDPAFLAH